MRQSVRGMLRALDPRTVNQYADYTRAIRPTTQQQVLDRWIFAFCSIHTTWQNNVKGFSALRGSDLQSELDIRARLNKARVGLHNSRARSLHLFGTKFWADPDRYSYPGRRLRDELSSELYGIGLAKVSFAFELIEPTIKIACLDRHVLRWLTGSADLNGSMSVKTYRNLEDRWIKACGEFDFEPVAARHASWDVMQQRPNMRYWSHVLEEDGFNEDRYFRSLPAATPAVSKPRLSIAA